MSNSSSSRYQFTEEIGKCSVTRRFIYVPKGDWRYIRRGAKDEFRGAGSLSGLEETPTPVALYSKAGVDRYEMKLAVLLDAWREPLGAISQEGLEAEGHATLEQFRTWWVERREPMFNALKLVTVYRVRPWEPQDSEEMGRALLNKLYPPEVFQR